MAGQDWFEKDFYATLGVPKDADAAAIKKAYRKLARQHHPDANDGDDTRFKEIGEAYSVLSDPEQRQQYDAIRSMSHGGARFAPGGQGGARLRGPVRRPVRRRRAPGGGGQRARFDSTGGIDLEDLLRGMGAGAGPAGGRGGRGFGGFGTRGPRRGADVNATTTLPFRDAVVGSTVTLRTPRGPHGHRADPGRGQGRPEDPVARQGIRRRPGRGGR